MAQVMETSVLVEGGPIHPVMNWGAILAGWLVATGMAGLLYVAGLALGFAAFNPHDVAATAKGIGIGTAVWVVLSWIAGLFVGGMFASWFDGKSDETMGAMHGVAVWGLSLTATALWLSLGMGFAFHHDKPVDDSVGPSGHASMVMTNDEAVWVLRADVHRFASHGEAVPAELSTEGAVVDALLSGHEAAAKAILLASTTETPESIDQALSSWSSHVSTAQAQFKARAEQAARYASMVLWIGFLSGLLALVTATWGGWLGANHIHRVYHTRRYAGRPFAVK
ncbi:hypothetical protein [Dyella sp. ASV21]|jgi:hypothetical protein|uniref:hypothetical protein n=1 Tax=Dyella sp. ASV21 TaxID=2795114 RepID=UPI0018EC234D|nr:hypothetical protein [Dyella sp. ASV21]